MKEAAIKDGNMQVNKGASRDNLGTCKYASAIINSLMALSNLQEEIIA